MDWLAGLIDPDPLLEGVTHTKLRQFAAEAAALEVSELLDISRSQASVHTLLLALAASGTHALSRRTGRDDAAPRPADPGRGQGAIGGAA